MIKQGDTAQILIEATGRKADVIVDEIRGRNAKIRVKCCNFSVRFVGLDKLIEKSINSDSKS